MCGISGIIDARKSSDELRHDVKRMTDAMVHRGPDDFGYYINKGIGLGMRRLSIIDLQKGNQPIHNEDKTLWIIFNGEIYNFKELRDTLIKKGHRFYTNSDTEVILHLYEDLGEDSINNLNGIFALALWDSKVGKLLLARDHFGVKPLYYHQNNQNLIFASEIKAIQKNASISKDVDITALDQYLTFRFVPSPRTMLNEIKKLQPGHLLTFEKGRLNIQRYYKPYIKIDKCKSMVDSISSFKTYLRSAVKRQMISDVPIGAMLSGGVDSATIVSLMTELSNNPIKTFTFGFERGGDLNELCEARSTSQLFGTEHHEIVVSDDQYIKDLPKSIEIIEEPIGTSSALAEYYVCKFAQQKVKVLLSGQGADEPLAGYDRYKGESIGHLYRYVPSAGRALIESITHHLPRNEKYHRAVRSLGLDDPCDRFLNIYSVFSKSMKDSLYKSMVRNQIPDDGPRECIHYWQKDVEHLNGLSQMLFIDSRFSLSDDLLLCADKTSMAASIEMRVPFLDVELMTYLESLPSDLKMKGMKGKYFYYKAISEWLPVEILKRKKKGFPTPIDFWFRSKMSNILKQTVFAPRSACMQYFSKNYVEWMEKQHKQGSRDFNRNLFLLLSFELWHSRFASA